MAEPRALTSILDVLLEHEVEFVLVGALAAVAQGAPVTTHDVDIVHARTPENLDRLMAALASMKARYRGGAPGSSLPPDRVRAEGSPRAPRPGRDSSPAGRQGPLTCVRRVSPPLRLLVADTELAKTQLKSISGDLAVALGVRQPAPRPVYRVKPVAMPGDIVLRRGQSSKEGHVQMRQTTATADVGVVGSRR
jgi:hypothetical protein